MLTASWPRRRGGARQAGILFGMVEAASGSLEEVVREVIFPVIGTQSVEALVREARAHRTPQSTWPA